MYKKAENKVYARIADTSRLRIAVIAHAPRPGQVKMVSVKTEPFINPAKPIPKSVTVGIIALGAPCLYVTWLSESPLDLAVRI